MAGSAADRIARLIPLCVTAQVLEDLCG